MQKTFAIGIPTINRYDLLQPSLVKYFQDFNQTEIVIIDNGNQGIKVEGDGIEIIKQERNLGVSGSWNLLCDRIFEKHDYAVILNDDIYLGKTDSQIRLFLFENSIWDFYVGTGTWCAFILPKKTWKSVGRFDENFYPAYFEDNDYHYRMKLQKKTYFQSEFLNPEVYRNSQTIAKDASLNNHFKDNQNYYVKKWGGEPGKELFATPEN